jgi:hypothetical protein
VRISIVFDVGDDGYRLGEFLDSDVQPVFLAYRDRQGDNVFLITGEWTAEELAEGLNNA